MVRTLVLALRMHSNRVVKRFLNYHGNSKFALQLPLVNPPLVFVVAGACRCHGSCATFSQPLFVSGKGKYWLYWFPSQYTAAAGPRLSSVESPDVSEFRFQV